MSLAKMDDQWIPLQVKVFSRWVQGQLKDTQGIQVDDITKDLNDGVALVDLAKILTEKETPRPWAQKPKSNFDKVQNCDLSVDMFTKDGVKLVGISGKDVNDNNEKLILGYIWTLILHYGVGKSVDSDSKENTTKSVVSDKDNKDALMNWASEKTENYPGINNFEPYDLSLCALLDSYVPEKIHYADLDQNDTESNAKLATDVMNDLGIPVYVYPDELMSHGDKVDQKTLLTQLSSAKVVLDKVAETRDINAENERKAKEEEEARRIAEEEAARLVAEEAERKAQEEQERLAEEEARRKAEEAAERLAEEAAHKAEEEARRKAEEAERLAEEEARKAAEEEEAMKTRDVKVDIATQTDETKPVMEVYISESTEEVTEQMTEDVSNTPLVTTEEKSTEVISEEVLKTTEECAAYEERCSQTDEMEEVVTEEPTEEISYVAEEGNESEEIPEESTEVTMEEKTTDEKEVSYENTTVEAEEPTEVSYETEELADESVEPSSESFFGVISEPASIVDQSVLQSEQVNTEPFESQTGEFQTEDATFDNTVESTIDESGFHSSINQMESNETPMSSEFVEEQSTEPCELNPSDVPPSSPLWVNGENLDKKTVDSPVVTPIEDSTTESTEWYQSSTQQNEDQQLLNEKSYNGSTFNEIPTVSQNRNQLTLGDDVWVECYTNGIDPQSEIELALSEGLTSGISVGMSTDEVDEVQQSPLTGEIEEVPMISAEQFEFERNYTPEWLLDNDTQEAKRSPLSLGNDVWVDVYDYEMASNADIPVESPQVDGEGNISVDHFEFTRNYTPDWLFDDQNQSPLSRNTDRNRVLVENYLFVKCKE